MKADAEVRELIDSNLDWLFNNYVLNHADIVKSVVHDREWDLEIKLKFFIVPPTLLNKLSAFTTNSEEVEK